jgi:hypothetical protein
LLLPPSTPSLTSTQIPTIQSIDEVDGEAAFCAVDQESEISDFVIAYFHSTTPMPIAKPVATFDSLK